MKHHSIRTKLLIFIIAAFIFTGVSVVHLADYQLFEIIDNSQYDLYAERVDTIIGIIARKYEHLQATRMVDAYEEDFKTSVLNALRNNYYYGVNQRIYPYILSLKGTILMHPVLPHGDTSLQNADYIKRAIKELDGDFNYVYENGEKKWCFFRTFKPWGWVIGYAIPIEKKYADLYIFRENLIIIMIGIVFFVVVMVAIIITAMIKPIQKLTNASKAFASGNLDYAIRVKSTDELGVLAQSFKQMRDAIREKIDNLAAKNEELIREISSRQRAQNALQASEERFRALVETSSDWIWEVDTEGRYTYVSPRIKTILGFTPEEVVGKKAFDLMPDDESKRVLCEFEAYVSEEKPIINLENKAHHKDGHIVILETNGLPFYDLDGNLMGYRGIDRDMTERKKSEEELHKLKDNLEIEVEKKTSELIEANKKLIQTERLAAIGQLGGNVAHEFRNQLGVIKNVSYYLKMIIGPADKRIMKHLRILDDQIATTDQIINNILLFARTKQPQFSTVNLHGFLKDVLKNIDLKKPQHIDIHTDIANNVPAEIVIDEAQMHQVFNNIIGNAFEAMKDKGSLSLSVKKADGHLSLVSIDTGKGIKQEYLERMFEPLFTTKASGAGFGLSTAKTLVERHGGFITAESILSSGTTITVCLPLVR